jgi:hypothetical protein
MFQADRCRSNHRRHAATLARALEVDNGLPTIVLLQAGDLNIGAFDPFAELIPLAGGSSR